MSGAVEGDLDGAVFNRIVAHAGGNPGDVYGFHGKQFVLNRVSGYNSAAKFHPWLVLVDLDDEAECAPMMASRWLPFKTRGMCFCIAVRKIEAWLLADPTNLSSFLVVSPKLFSSRPETDPNPKQTLVNIARRSRSSGIRQDMVPVDGGGRVVGPGYTSRLSEFVVNRWDLEGAAKSSDSLDRCLRQMKEIVQADTRG